MYPQTLRSRAIIGQHALRGIDPGCVNNNGIDVDSLGRIDPDSADLMPTLDRIHQRFGITVDGTKAGSPLRVSQQRLNEVIYFAASDTVELLADAAGWHSVHRGGPWISKHTRASELQELLLTYPDVRQGLTAEIDSRAAQVMAGSKARQEKVVSDYHQKLQQPS